LKSFKMTSVCPYVDSVLDSRRRGHF
jgi:hypothetical protein